MPLTQIREKANNIPRLQKQANGCNIIFEKVKETFTLLGKQKNFSVLGRDLRKYVFTF